MKTFIEAKGNRIIMFALAVNVLMQLVNTMKGVIAKGVKFGDYIWIWKESVCTVHGKNIIEAINNNSVIDGVTMPSSSSTMPYARVLANLIHPGFMQERTAIIYGIVLYLTAIVTAIVIMYKILQKECRLHNKTILLFVVLLTFSPWYWVDGILTWNNGVLFSMFLILSVLIVDDHEIASGILLALSMIKPQLAGIFYISFFIKKKYKAILTSCIILVASWTIYLIFVGGGGVIAQMAEMMVQTDEKKAGFLWFGMFDFMLKFGASGCSVILSGMIMGIIATAILSVWVMKSKKINCTIVYYSIPALISTVWCYKSTSDLVILVLPCLLCLLIMEHKNVTWLEYLFTMTYLFMLNVKVFCGIIRRLLGYEWLTGVNLDAYTRVLMFLMMLFLLERINGRSCESISEAI